MKDVYKAQFDIENEAKKAATERQHEKDLAEFFVRTEALGISFLFLTHICLYSCT